MSIVIDWLERSKFLKGGVESIGNTAWLETGSKEAATASTASGPEVPQASNKHTRTEGNESEIQHSTPLSVRTVFSSPKFLP